MSRAQLKEEEEEEEDASTFYSEQEEGGNGHFVSAGGSFELATEDQGEDLGASTERLRERLNRIELANQKFNAYAQRLNQLSEDQSRSYQDEFDLDEEYGEDYFHPNELAASNGFYKDYEEDDFDDDLVEMDYSVQRKEPVARRPSSTKKAFRSDFDQPAVAAAAVKETRTSRHRQEPRAQVEPRREQAVEWEALEKELRAEVLLAKRRAQRAEILQREAEHKASALQVKLNETTRELHELMRQQQQQQPRVTSTLSSRRSSLLQSSPREDARSALAHRPLASALPEQRRRSSSSRRPPFVPGGNSLVSNNRRVPILSSTTDSTKLMRMREKKRALDEKYRNLLRYGGEDEEQTLTALLSKIHDLQRKIDRAAALE